MKALLTSAALAAMLATGATAGVVGTSGTVHWTGSATLSDMCEFTQLDNGKMDLNETTGAWTVDTNQPAEVTIAYRGVSKITVEADNSKKWQTSHQYATDGSLVYGFNVNNGNGVIHGHTLDPTDGHGEVFDADVEYGGSTYKTTQDGGKETNVTTVAANSSSFTVAIPNNHSYAEEFSGVASIEIRGTATPTGVAIYYSDDEYHVPHKITCVQ